MTPIAEILAHEIATKGPITFHRFMSAALYYPQHGYYRNPRDPFGRAGDFYTAEQIQPVFGILIAQLIRHLRAQLGNPTEFQVIELGAGRAEMAPALSEFGYTPIDAGTGELPPAFTGLIFANEFFDALPVHVVQRNGATFTERLVTYNNQRFQWCDGPPLTAALEEYVQQHAPDAGLFEVNLDALQWLHRIKQSLTTGYLLAIDYGYTHREAIRFPQGTLMSYHRHTALDDVLVDPGDRDITAHVAFTPLMNTAVNMGFEVLRFETMMQLLMHAGEADQFAAAMAASPQQLKTLLFGMGETFRALLLRVGK